ncbi:MAG: hypothetical protein J6A91_08825 [Bacteroidales bacterium]|nr:hypothetical protein [Bacteroidales bacterium]
MKGRFVKTVAALMAVLTFGSCVEEIMHNEPHVDGVVTFTAYSDSPESKAVLRENLSHWYGEEWIQVVGRNGNYWFNAYENAPSATTVFSYNGDNGEYKEEDVFAVYPGGSSNYGPDFENMCVSGVTIPSKQNATPGSYDKDAAPAIAYSTDDNLHFKNVAALLKFTMGSDGIKNVTVWGEMSEVEGGNLPDFVKEGHVYLTVASEWLSDGARFAAYMWNDGGNTWKSMEAVEGQADMYSCEVPEGYGSIIFCRMNGGTSSNSWDKDNMWNQTVDLSLSDGNHFTIGNPWDSAKEGKATGSWSTFSATTTAGISGTGTVCFNDGKPQMKGASTGYVSLNGDFEKGKTYYIAVAPVVFEKGFSVEFSTVGDYDKFEVKKYDRKIEFKASTVYNMGVLCSTNETGFFTDPILPNADEPCTIYYRPAKEDDLYSQTGDLYAHIWLRTGGASAYGSEWGVNDEKYKLTKVEDGLWSMTLSPSIREWFGSGESPCERIGILARTADAKTQTGDSFIDVTDDLYGTPDMPEGLHHGINYIDNSTVTLVLYDRHNTGKSHHFCNLLWDDNWWGYEEKPKMPLNYDDKSGCWWITLTDLNPDRQYKFQYQLGYDGNVTVHTFDPYTEIVYDRSNDQWISSSTYPGLAEEYGDTHGGRDNGFISAFKINKDEYAWKVKDYDIEDKNDLVIYELLVRDFTDNSYGEGSIKAALGQIDYLRNLGVNAIELMPIQEFDGNDSWGYGPHAYFAMDKAYGTRNDYKAFIDACHQNGMAVLLDVTYNHATGVHPYAAMYWDGTNNKTAPNNPWFNVDAPHQWSVYHDWNHSNPMVREHVKRNLTYLMTEYKVDGFRFDLTKGFTQNSGTEGTYDQSRVDYLKEYNAHILSVDKDAVMICEHFCDEENYELGLNGIKVWRNMNHSYCKAMKRDMSQADFTGTTNTFDGGSGMMGGWQTFGQYVGYQESHDEQRTGFEGQWDYSGNEIPFATRMERAKINAAFFLLSPGPKMIWQFGEIGYDINIEDNGRVGKKPCKTAEYMAVPERKALYDTYAMLLKFRKDNPRFFDSDVNFRWYVDGGHQEGRYMFAKDGDGNHFALFGNFGVGQKTIGVELPTDGPWYEYATGKEWNGRQHSPSLKEGGFYLLVDNKAKCMR